MIALSPADPSGERPYDFDQWRSGWFWIDSYEPSPGHARLLRGPVDDVVAVVTRLAWDGQETETFHLRWDPIRQAIDLIVRIDFDEPASLESTTIVAEELGEVLQVAADVWDPAPGRLFGLLATHADGIDIRELTDDEFREYDLTGPRFHAANSDVEGVQDTAAD